MTGYYYEAVAQFKRELISRVLREHGNNRSRAARTLGLQRTYLLRLIHELPVQVPPGARGRSRAA